MHPKVFVIILHWNSDADTRECLQSLADNDYPSMRVVIVDNGSSKKFLLPNSPLAVKVIYNAKNLGFAGGNNVGIQYALKHGADYVLLLNNDTTVNSSFLSGLVKAGQEDPHIGVLGPKIYCYNDRKKIWSAGGEINWLYNKAVMRGYGEQDQGQYDAPAVQETQFVTGCCLLIKKEVIEGIGLMSAEYFLYYEDVDWSLAARRAGYKCAFVPGAVIWHKGSQGSKAGSEPYIYYHVRNGLLLASCFAPWHVKPFVHLDACQRVVKQMLKWLFMPSKRKWARYILLGIKDFYFGKKGKHEDWY